MSQSTIQVTRPLLSHSPRRPKRTTPPLPTQVTNPFRTFCGDEKKLWKEIRLTNSKSSEMIPTLRNFVLTYTNKHPDLVINRAFHPDGNRQSLFKWLPTIKQYYSDLSKLGKWKGRLSTAATQLVAMTQLLQKPENEDARSFLEKVHQHVQGLINPSQSLHNKYPDTQTAPARSEEDPLPPLQPDSFSPKKFDRLASMRTFEPLYKKVREANGAVKRTHSAGGKRSFSPRKRTSSLPTLRRKDTPPESPRAPKNSFQEFIQTTNSFYKDMKALRSSLEAMDTIDEFIRAKSKEKVSQHMPAALTLFSNLKYRLRSLLESEEINKTADFLKGFNPTMSSSDTQKELLPLKEYYSLVAKLHLAAHLFGSVADFSADKTLEAQFRRCSDRLTQLPTQFAEMIERLDTDENLAVKALFISVKQHIEKLLKENNTWLTMADTFRRGASDESPPEFCELKRTVLNDKDLNSAVERMIDTTRNFYRQIDALHSALKKIENRHIPALVLAKKKGSSKKQIKQVKQHASLTEKEKGVLFLLKELKGKVSKFANSLERKLVSTLLEKLPKSLENPNFLTSFPERMRDYYAMTLDIRTYAYVFDACATFSGSVVSNIVEGTDIARVIRFAKTWITEERHHINVLLSKVKQGTPAYDSLKKLALILEKDVTKTPYDLKLLFAYRAALSFKK